MTDLGHAVVLSFLVSFALVSGGAPPWLLALVVASTTVLVLALAQ